MKMIRHLGKLSKPAKRAIFNSGITTLEELSAFSEREVAKWHGIGPHALITIRVILEENGLARLARNELYCYRSLGKDLVFGLKRALRTDRPFFSFGELEVYYRQ